MPTGSASKTYGIVAADRQKEMTGLEFVQGLVDGTLPLNTIAQTLSYDITEAESGRVVITAVPNDSHLNPAGTVHGGFSARCSIAAWDWPSCRLWRKASVRRLSNSRFHSCGPSPLRQA